MGWPGYRRRCKMKGTRTKFTVALLLALILVMTLAVMPAYAGGNKVVVQKFIQADTGGSYAVAALCL